MEKPIVCKCGCGEVLEKHSYETIRQWEKRLKRGLFRAGCKKNLPSPPVRGATTNTLISARYGGELVAQEKESPVRDLARLAFARSMPCFTCGEIQGVHAHHEQEPGHGTMGGKTSDRRTVPLCAGCHQLRHETSRSFWGNVDVEAYIRDLNDAYDAYTTKEKRQ